MSHYIRYVHSTVKGGVNRELGPKTIIIGPNGSMKSAIVQSIQLATRGVVSEIDGRYDVAEPARLLRLFDRESLTPSCLSEVAFSDGSIARWSVPEGKSKGLLSLPAMTNDARLNWQPDSVEPLSLLRAATLGTDATQRAFFLERVGLKTTIEIVKVQMPTRLFDKYLSLKSALGSRLAEVDFLLRATEESAKRQRTSTATAKEMRALLVNLGNGSATGVEDDSGLRAQLVGIEATLSQTGSQVEARRSLQAALDAARDADQALRTAQTYLAGTRAATQGAEARFERASAGAAVKPEHRRALMTLRDTLQVDQSAMTTCLACGANHDRRELGQRETEINNWIESNDAAAVGLQAAERDLRTAATEERRCESELQHAEANRDVREVQRSSMIAVHPELYNEATDSVVDTGELEADIKRASMTKQANELRTRIANSQAARLSLNKLQTARNDADQHDQDAGDWKDLGVNCKRIIGLLLKDALESFNTMVQSHLPSSDRFRMLVEGEDLKHIEFGLEATGVGGDNYLKTALSGAERARVHMALASAIASDAYHYIVPDDTGYDARTLSLMLASFASAPGQVIIATPTEPMRIGSEWTVIRTGGNL